MFLKIKADSSAFMFTVPKERMYVCSALHLYYLNYSCSASTEISCVAFSFPLFDVKTHCIL